MLSFRRARRHAAWYATIALIAAVLTGTSVVLAGMLSAAADDGIRTGLAGRAGADLAFRAALALGDDPDRQDEQVRATLGRALAGVSPAPAVSRSVSGEASLRVGDDRAARAGIALSDPELADHADLTSGRWASSAAEATMQADAAEGIGVGPGTVLTVDDTLVTVTGLWRVTDALDPRWLGESQILEGRGEGIGPVLLDESVFAALHDADATARWTVVPDAGQATADDLSHFVSAWAAIPRGWHGQVDDVSGASKTGGLAATSTALLRQVQGLRAIEPVALLLLIASGIVAVTEVARLVTRGRGDEYALLWARGRSESANAGSAAAAVAVAVAAGALVGAGAGTAVTAGLTGVIPGSIAGTVVVPLTLALTGALVAARTAQLSSRGAAATASSARARRVAAPALAVLVAGAAGVSVWQLRLYGSPVTTAADGSASVDPLIVGAPVLALLGIALLALVLFPLLARLVARVASRASVPRMLGTLTVARDLPRAAAQIIVVALAFGAVTVAAAYSGTWALSFQRTNELRTGSDVSVSAPGGGFTGTQLDDITGLPGVVAVAPVVSRGVQLGDTASSLVSISPDALVRVARSAAGTIDPVAIADAIRADVPALRAPAATTLTIAARTTGFPEPPRVVARVVDADGREFAVDADVTATTPDTVSYALVLPGAPDDADVRVLALDVIPAQDTDFGDTAGTFAPTVGDGTDSEPWYPALDSAPALDGGGFVAEGGTVRLLPGVQAEPARIPVAVSRALADRYGLDVGGTVTFSFEGDYTLVDAQVAAVVEAVPAAPTELAVLADATALTARALAEGSPPPSATSLWIDSSDPPATAAALRTALPPSSSIRVAADPSSRTITGAAALSLWAVAGCGIALALLTVAALSRAELRRRLPETAVLRAVGLAPRQQAALRSTESGFVLVYAAVVGIVAGVATALLTVPELVTAAVPDAILSLGSRLAVDTVGLAAAVLPLAIGLALIVGASGIAVARAARRARVDGARP